jgi:amino acid transporter
VAVCEVVATTSVLLVFQLGQPRIWMSMSRDGLLPKQFAKVHPKYQTPSFSTIITGLMVGIPSLFVGSGTMTDLTSIGTLFAFVLVCFGVLVLPKLTEKSKAGAFQLPYINGKLLIPAIVLTITFLFRSRITDAFANMGTEGYQEVLFLIFMVIALITAFYSFLRSYSFIPVAGALCCLYLMIEIPAISWFWFFVWMALGLVIYFLYGRHKSKLSS